MDDFIDVFIDNCIKKKPISFDYLLSLSPNLPIRFVNILKNENFYSEESFFEKVEELYLEYESHFLFPNKLIAFYPQIIEKVASHDITCNLSGAKIKTGSFYCTYHPFMEDIENGRVYTIQKRINAESGFIDYFPQNLVTYEDWYYKLKNAYYQTDDIIDFYFLSRECGENCLEPYSLGISKKKRKK